MPVFVCGHHCTWDKEWWTRRPRAKYYCGVCQRPQRIRHFPWLDTEVVWDWMAWNGESERRSFAIDRLRYYEMVNQRHIWSSDCFDHW